MDAIEAAYARARDAFVSVSLSGGDFDERLRAAIAAYLEAQWQPIETAPKMRKVIVRYVNALGKNRCVLACYYLANALEMSDDYQDVGEWEGSENGFAPEGWYEEVDHGGDIYHLSGDPIEWMPLPPIDSARGGEHG